MRIFISYRRTDLAMYLVDELRAELVSAVGEGNVFLDIDNVPPGVDFRRHIAQAVDDADTVLAVIGPSWQPDRLFRHTDFVRTELLSAAELNKTVIPVLIGGREMPPPADLPPELEWLVWRNAFTVAPPPRHRDDLRRLADHFRRSIEATEPVKAKAPRLRRSGPVVLSPETPTSEPSSRLGTTPPPRSSPSAPRDGDRRMLVRRVVHDGNALSVSWSPDGRWLASSGADGLVNVIVASPSAADSIAVRSTLRQRGHVSSVAWSPDGSRLVSGGSDRSIRLWNLDDPTPARTMTGHRSAVLAVAWSSDGALLASAGVEQVRLWPLATPAEPKVLDFGASALAWSGTTLATVGPDSSVRIIDGPSGKPTMRSFHAAGSRLFGVAWEPAGDRLCVGGDDRLVRVGQPGRFRSAARFAGHTDYVRCVAWSPDGRLIASGSADRSVRLWDASSGEQIAKLTGNTHGVRCVAWSPDGTRLASAANDGAVCIWTTSNTLG